MQISIPLCIFLCVYMGCGAVRSSAYAETEDEENAQVASQKNQHSADKDLRRPALNYASTKYSKPFHRGDLPALNHRKQVQSFLAETFLRDTCNLAKLCPSGDFENDFEVLAGTKNSDLLVNDDLWAYFDAGCQPREFDRRDLNDEIAICDGMWRARLRREARKRAAEKLRNVATEEKASCKEAEESKFDPVARPSAPVQQAPREGPSAGPDERKGHFQRKASVLERRRSIQSKASPAGDCLRPTQRRMSAGENRGSLECIAVVTNEGVHRKYVRRKSSAVVCRS